MILLLETCPKIRVENQGKKLFLEGVYISCSKPTANRRRYLPETVERAVSDATDKIRNQQMFGQLGHPKDSGGDLSRVSHVVKSLTRKGNEWIGRSEVISEGAGKILRSIIESTGGRGIGMSTRSIGEVQNKGGENVVTSMVLLGVDAVESAAGVGCFGRAVYENLQQNAYSLNESFIATQLLTEVASQDASRGSSLADYDRNKFDVSPYGAKWSDKGDFSRDGRTFPDAMFDDTNSIIERIAALQNTPQWQSQTYGDAADLRRTIVQAAINPMTKSKLLTALGDSVGSAKMRNVALQLMNRIGKYNR